MIDYQIQPSTRRCCVSGRELRPGERCFTVLLDQGGRFVRRDYAPESWAGPPPESPESPRQASPTVRPLALRRSWGQRPWLGDSDESIDRWALQDLLDSRRPVNHDTVHPLTRSKAEVQAPIVLARES